MTDWNRRREKRLAKPKPGDYWNECFCPIMVVLEVVGPDELVICDKTKSMGPDHWTWDLDKARTVDRAEFERLAEYGLPSKWRHKVFVKAYWESKRPKYVLHQIS